MSTEEKATESAGLKPVPPGKRRRLQQCFDNGTVNVARGNYDYAVDMFSQAFSGDPANLIYAQNLVTTLHKKYNNNKKGGTLAGLKGTGFKKEMKKAVSKKDWESAFKSGAELLKLNPWDIPSLLAIASACEEVGANECLLFFLKCALDVNLRDPDANRAAAQSLTKLGDFDEALACWQRLERAKPDDEEAKKMAAELAAQLSGRPEEEERKSLFDDVDPNKRKEELKLEAEEKKKEEARPQPSAQVGLTPEKKLLSAIEREPEETSHYVDLSEVYAREDKIDQAIAAMSKALELTGGGDVRLRERVEELQIRKARRQYEIAERRAHSERTEESVALARRLKGDLNKVELEIYAIRCERNPGNINFRYELGLRLKKAGQFSEAIQNFQQARSDLRRKALVLLELGECFQHIKQYKLAMSNYEQSIESATEKDDDTKKLALYRAAVLAMGLKEWESAEKHLTELAGLDFGYKDVADRLDKLAKIRDDG